jgi:hypothetical protein
MQHPVHIRPLLLCHEEARRAKSEACAAKGGEHRQIVDIGFADVVELIGKALPRTLGEYLDLRELKKGLGGMANLNESSYAGNGDSSPSFSSMYSFILASRIP